MVFWAGPKPWKNTQHFSSSFGSLAYLRFTVRSATARRRGTTITMNISTLRINPNPITTETARRTATHRNGILGCNGTYSYRFNQFQQRKKAPSIIVCSTKPLVSVVDHQGVNESGLSRIESLSQVSGVLGCQWGDEGKGKLVDILAKHFDIVARCQVHLYEVMFVNNFWIATINTPDQAWYVNLKNVSNNLL